MDNNDDVVLTGDIGKVDDKSLFVNSGSLRMDDCAQALQDKTNAYWSKHQLYNPAKCDGTNDDEISRFAAKYPNLRIRRGVGNVDSCNVDNDSTLRTGGFDVRRKRYQLFPREFQAVPDMGRGDFLPELDNMLSRGSQREYERRPNSIVRDCESLSEKENDRMTPMLQCLKQTVQDPKNIVPTWTWGGDSARMLNRSPEFLESCGFKLVDERKQTWMSRP